MPPLVKIEEINSGAVVGMAPHTDNELSQRL